jgi:hypothetical protein
MAMVLEEGTVAAGHHVCLRSVSGEACGVAHEGGQVQTAGGGRGTRADLGEDARLLQHDGRVNLAARVRVIGEGGQARAESIPANKDVLRGRQPRAADAPQVAVLGRAARRAELAVENDAHTRGGIKVHNRRREECAKRLLHCPQVQRTWPRQKRAGQPGGNSEKARTIAARRTSTQGEENSHTTKRSTHAPRMCPP